MPTTDPEKSRSTPPPPWMFVRLLRPGEDELLVALDEIIQAQLASCQRCTDIYMQTGLIPVECHICDARRDTAWLSRLEEAASACQPVIKNVEQALEVIRRVWRKVYIP